MSNADDPNDDQSPEESPSSNDPQIYEEFEDLELTGDFDSTESAEGGTLNTSASPLATTTTTPDPSGNSPSSESANSTARHSSDSSPIVTPTPGSLILEGFPPDVRVERTTTTGSPDSIAAFKTEFRREADRHELRLGIFEEARAISHVFQTAKGEFCFALFGRWGRGKSTILKQLKSVLEKPNLERFPDYSTYEFVDFSAWMYPSLPQLWVYLYERFASGATTAGKVKSLPIAIRAFCFRNGVLKVAFSFLIFALLLIPLTSWVQAARFLIPIFGIGTILFLWRLYRSVHNSELLAPFFGLRTHETKLGLQSAIGRDLHSLLKAWIPEKMPQNSSTEYKAFWWICILAYVILAIAVFLVWFTNSGWPQLLVCIVSLGVAVAVVEVISMSLWGKTVLPYVVKLLGKLPIFRTGIASEKRILLCIDDLDRCQLDEMLQVIESIKLFLNDPEINSRLQVVCLLDPNILSRAIAIKHNKLLEAPDFSFGLPMKMTWVIQENLEKYFAAHFEFLPLNNKDTLDLLDIYTSGERPNRSTGPEESIKAGDLVFSEDDQENLKQAIRDGSWEDPTYSPRRLRHLLFQYQIAKLLMRERRTKDIESKLSEIATASAAEIFDGNTSAGANIVDMEAKSVFGQVSFLRSSEITS